MIDIVDNYSIGAVERDTGIGRDTLRIWERRYGFPNPGRNEKGERIYPEPQLRMLQRVRRLLDQGVRPGQLLPPDEAKLVRLESDLGEQSKASGTSASIDEVLKALSASNTGRIKELFEALYTEQGLERFVLETVAPMLTTLGNRWFTGDLRVFHEHILSQYLVRFLNAKILEQESANQKPGVILATLPGEQHSLGLLMVASLLAVEGIESINLGSEAPIDEINQAVKQSGARILGLTFSSAYPYNAIRSNLVELRNALPESTEIWIGGEGVRRLRKLPEGVQKFLTLENLGSQFEAIQAS